MTLAKLTRPFTWSQYSRKLAAKISRPRAMGYYTSQDAQARGMHLAEGRAGSLQNGNKVALYWLVDPSDGIIVDAKFQVFGHSALIGAAEVACDLVIGKNYDQAQRISCDLLDQQVQDKSGTIAFPDETGSHLNLVLDALDEASVTCVGIPLEAAYVAPPVSGGAPIEGDGYPGWQELSLQKKLAVIEQVVAQEIRPYIEMDAGGVEVLNLLNDREVIIAYQGACTSCFSATGATLSYIQQVLRARVDKDLVVIPNL
jgi:NifU-like protein